MKIIVLIKIMIIHTYQLIRKDSVPDGDLLQVVELLLNNLGIDAIIFKLLEKFCVSQKREMILVLVHAAIHHQITLTIDTTLLVCITTSEFNVAI